MLVFHRNWPPDAPGRAGISTVDGDLPAAADRGLTARCRCDGCTWISTHCLSGWPPLRGSYCRRRCPDRMPDAPPMAIRKFGDLIKPKKIALKERVSFQRDDICIFPLHFIFVNLKVIRISFVCFKVLEFFFQF